MTYAAMILVFGTVGVLTSFPRFRLYMSLSLLAFGAAAALVLS